jgi:hypothetical protein
VSAQPLTAEAASLIEDETFLDPEKSRMELWDPGNGRLTRFCQSHDRGWKPLPPATNFSLKMALIFMKFHMRFQVSARRKFQMSGSGLFNFGYWIKD